MLTQEAYYAILNKHNPYPDRRIIPVGISLSSLYRKGTIFDDYAVRLNVKGRPKVLTNEGGDVIIAEIDRVIAALTSLRNDIIDAVKYEELAAVVDTTRKKL